MTERLKITISVGGHEHQIVRDDFDIQTLHPARRKDVLTMIDADLGILARKLGVHDYFAEMMRQMKEVVGAAEFAVMVADLDDELRLRLLRCGVIGPLDPGRPLT